MSVSKTDLKGSWHEPTTIWNRMFLSIFFANMMLNFCQYMSNSQLSLYAKSIGTPADQIGVLMSMFAVTALICRFFSGPAMGAFNRKKLVALSMSFMTAAYFGFSFSADIASALGLETITVLKFFRLVQGLGNAFGNSCCLTIVSDALPKDKFSSGMGYYACGQVVSQALGPTVGVFLGNHLGFKTSYIIVGIVMLLAIAALVPVRTAPHERVKFSLKFKDMVACEALVPAGISFFLATGFTAVNSFLLVYTAERGIEGASLFFTVYAVAMLVTRPLIGKLNDRFGFVAVGVPAALMTAVSLALIGLSGNIYTLLLTAVINAFGYGACQPALQSLCMKSVPPERRGSAASTNYIGQDAATIIGPTVCGYVAKAAGYTPVMWLVMTVPVIIGVLFIIAFRKNINKIEKSFATPSKS